MNPLPYLVEVPLREVDAGVNMALLGSISNNADLLLMLFLCDGANSAAMTCN